MPTNRGMVGLKSIHGAYLQARADGEMRAGDKDRNEEETWFLIEIDSRNRLYAIQNWKNGKYLSNCKDGCIRATETVIGSSEHWEFVSGPSYGIENAVAMRSAKDGAYICANEPGVNGRSDGELGFGNACHACF